MTTVETLAATSPLTRYPLLRWCLRRWHRLRKATIDRRKGVLVYVGLHKGREFDFVFKQYRVCYGFEANPTLFRHLKEKYKDYPNVHLFNCAVTETNGPITLHISNNNGASSSLGSFDENWQNHKSGEIKMIDEVTVEGVNLSDFCRDKNIAHIDDYISDIQGMDLTVLKSLRPFIEERRIGTITVEITREARRNIYSDLPSNSESGFIDLLRAHYNLVSVGFGVLDDYWFADIPAESWEMDTKWRRRTALGKWLAQS